MSNINKKICCLNKKIVFDEDEVKFICENCGLQYEGLFDEDAEKQSTREDENKIQFVEASNKNENIKQFPKLSRIHRNFSRIDRLLQGKALKNIIDETKNLYIIIDNNKNLRGRKIDHIIIGIYYYVLIKNDQAKSIKEISKQFNVTERIIKKAFNSIKDDIVVYTDEKEINNIEKNYVESFIGKRYNLKSLSYKIIDNIKGKFLEGKSPNTIAGLSLCLSCKLLSDNLYDKEDFFSKFSNKNTLENAFEEIKGYLHLIIPQKYVDKINELQSKRLFL